MGPDLHYVMSLNLLTNLHLADSSWSVSLSDILVGSENIFHHSPSAQLFCPGQCFYTWSLLSTFTLLPFSAFPRLRLGAGATLGGRGSPINYSLMTSVAQRLGRKKKLIYLSRGNCPGAVPGHKSSLCPLFLTD